MRIRRSLRRAWSGVLACAVLFTQLVTTAHACPRAGSAQAPATPAAMPCEMMSGAAVPDADLSGVCKQHCQFGTTQQPAEPMHLLPAPAAMPALLFVLVPAPSVPGELTAWRVHERERERAPPPDPRVANCCYRL